MQPTKTYFPLPLGFSDAVSGDSDAFSTRMRKKRRCPAFNFSLVGL